MHVANKHTKYTVTSVFYEVQSSINNHTSHKRILTDIYNKTKLKQFLEEFVKCLKVCLIHEEKSSNVEKTLDFAADFAVSFCSEEEENCPLLEGVFKFIFDNHDCQIQLVRLRICQLMNRLLDNMGQDASVLEETYNKIAESMLVRLKDSMSSVRTQAVYALHRLQSPSDPECDIIAAFKYHMMHDPCHEVRRAVIQKIAVTKTTLQSVLTRVNDVKDVVRKEAYVFIKRLLVRQFTIKQRHIILESGLNDRSEMVRDYVIGTLVPYWLKYFNYNYYEFLECIHVEKIPDTGIKVLKAIFEKQHDVILESRVKDMHITNQQIPYNKLNPITVVYWRALAEYVQPTDDNDKFEHIFEQVVPNLTPFCKYIRGYLFPTKKPHVEELSVNDSEPVPVAMDVDSPQPDIDRPQPEVDCQCPEITSSQPEDTGPQPQVNSSLPDIVPQNSPQDSSNERNTESQQEGSMDTNNQESAVDVSTSDNSHEPDEAVLVHLLEMCKVYDLADEMGRNHLRQLCCDLLQSSAVTQQSTVAILAGLLDHAVVGVLTKLSVMAEIITELREPLQAHDVTTVSVPDLLLMEAEEKKAELNDKIKELDTEMEIVQELSDEARILEINELKAALKEELKIMNSVTPHEPGRNVNNDPETLKKCLTIIVEIMQKGKITKMNPTLYSLMQNFVFPTIKLRVEGDSAPVVKNLAMQVLGIFCVLDIELAKEHFMTFCFNIATESISVTALKCVFDCLHVYGLSTFNIEDPDSPAVKEDTGDGKSKPNLIILLMSLLNSESVEMRKTATLGLCKLLFAGRIKSADLVTKLIMLWYDPAVECDPQIRQPLGAFFTMFASSCPHAPKLLTQAFLPTLKEVFDLEINDPTTEVEVDSVANLLVDLTRPGFNTHVGKDYSIHNQIAIQLCEEVLACELGSLQCTVLMKTLTHLDLNFDLTKDISILSALASRMVKSIPKEDKTMYRLALKLENMLQVGQENNKTFSTVNNTLPAEQSIKSSTARTTLLLARDSGSEEEAEEEEDEDEDMSQDMTTLHTIVDPSEAKVIPGTPETSDSESDELSSCPSDLKFSRLVTEEEEDFKGFKPQFKGFSPGFKGFKEPAAPPPPTPAKPNKTPRKAGKTPAKVPEPSASALRTPSKTPSATPAKATRSSARTPAKTPQFVNSLVAATEELTISPDPEPKRVSDRVTRSTKKRKL